MKKNIHPKYFPKAEIKCACGNVIKTGSTVEKMEVEICSACHPFFTGKKKLVDSTGRVDRFQQRLKKSAQIKEKRAASKKTKKTKVAKKTKKTDKKTTSKK